MDWYAQISSIDWILLVSKPKLVLSVNATIPPPPIKRNQNNKQAHFQKAVGGVKYILLPLEHSEIDIKLYFI